MKLHYRGDRTDFDPDQVLGPDRYRACYLITSAEYDPAADTTTATLRAVPPAEREVRAEQFMADYIARGAARRHLQKLFGGAA